MDENLERFLRYVKIDTQSNDQSQSVPSEKKELNLTKLLQKELNEIGISSYIDEFGVLYGKLDGENDMDPVGLNAHVDTALELSGKDVKPQIIKNYDGGEIKLNSKYSMSSKDFKTLKEHIGDDLVVTSGDTLLGADDKAGVAIIMSTLTYFARHKEIKHRPICFSFSVDEEIGRGADHFDAKKLGAKYAYTIDGGKFDEIAIETFNAAHADVTIQGFAIHPGEAKGKLLNASTLAFEFDRLLPALKRPEYTENREGFNHLISINGTVEEANMHYIIRNHDKFKLEEQKEEFIKAANLIKEKYPNAKIKVDIKDDYRNMKEILDKHPEAIETAKKAFEKLNITPCFPPIRGGTDGATFSFKGCPTPNLGTGSYNHHGRYEYLSIKEFNLMIEIVKEIMKK